jgi:hypothetical protein
MDDLFNVKQAGGRVLCWCMNQRSEECQINGMKKHNGKLVVITLPQTLKKEKIP